MPEFTLSFSKGQISTFANSTIFSKQFNCDIKTVISQPVPKWLVIIFYEKRKKDNNRLWNLRIAVKKNIQAKVNIKEDLYLTFPCVGVANDLHRCKFTRKEVNLLQVMLVLGGVCSFDQLTKCNRNCSFVSVKGWFRQNRPMLGERFTQLSQITVDVCRIPYLSPWCLVVKKLVVFHLLPWQPSKVPD